MSSRNVECISKQELRSRLHRRIRTLEKSLQQHTVRFHKCSPKTTAALVTYSNGRIGELRSLLESFQ